MKSIKKSKTENKKEIMKRYSRLEKCPKCGGVMFPKFFPPFEVSPRWKYEEHISVRCNECRWYGRRAPLDAKDEDVPTST